jgi:hypothetical protein
LQIALATAGAGFRDLAGIDRYSALPSREDKGRDGTVVQPVFVDEGLDRVPGRIDRSLIGLIDAETAHQGASTIALRKPDDQRERA